MEEQEIIITLQEYKDLLKEIKELATMVKHYEGELKLMNYIYQIEHPVKTKTKEKHIGFTQ